MSAAGEQVDKKEPLLGRMQHRRDLYALLDCRGLRHFGRFGLQLQTREASGDHHGNRNELPGPGCLQCRYHAHLHGQPGNELAHLPRLPRPGGGRHGHRPARRRRESAGRRVVLCDGGRGGLLRPGSRRWPRARGSARPRVPCRGNQSCDGDLIPPALFTPWIWVDNPLSLVAGREIYGYPKGPGIITGFPQASTYNSLTAIPIPTPLLKNSPPSLALSVFGGNAADLYWSYHPLIKLVPVPLSAAPPQPLSLAQWLQELPSLYPNTAPLLENWSSAGATQVFLKQFPDITSTQFACFQQINSAQYQIQKIYSTQAFIWPIELTISPLDTDDLCLALGIPATIPIAGGIQVVVDFLLTDGSVLWPSP